MSWYLFNNSPERQLRGKKVDGYQNLPKHKVILDWGLGELSPKKQSIVITDTIESQYDYNNFSKQQKNIKSLNQPKYRPQDKTKTIQNTTQVLTQSSNEENQQELFKELDNYGQKKNKFSNQYLSQANTYEVIPYDLQKNNNSLNVLNPIEFDTQRNNGSKNKPHVDSQTAKRMRFLQNSLLPGNRRDNMTAVLDYDLNSKVAISSLSDSRLSGTAKLGNKKNESQVRLGDGYNSFVPMKEKVKDMNQKLKQMYDYDEWCKKRETSQIRFG